MLFGRKNKGRNEFRIDLGDLENEKENLSIFLQSNLKLTVAFTQKSLAVTSENLSVQDLKRIVTKFVYHRHLSNTHWVSIEGATVKINRFKSAEKKKEKRKKESLHQTAIQSWGL